MTMFVHLVLKFMFIHPTDSDYQNDVIPFTYRAASPFEFSIVIRMHIMTSVPEATPSIAGPSSVNNLPE